MQVHFKLEVAHADVHPSFLVRSSCTQAGAGLLSQMICSKVGLWVRDLGNPSHKYLHSPIFEISIEQIVARDRMYRVHTAPLWTYV